MARLAALGIRRLRSLFDVSPEIEIKPLTILVGKNGAGKSTFARLFPLLRQSAERRKRSPILWYDELVDFGSFSEAVSRGETFIELTFVLRDLRQGMLRRAALARLPIGKIDLSEVKITLTLEAGATSGSDTNAKTLQIEFAEKNIHFTFNSREFSGLFINGKDYTADATTAIVHQGSILPTLIFFRKDDSGNFNQAHNPWAESIANLLAEYDVEPSEFLIRFINAIPVTDAHTIQAWFSGVEIAQIRGPVAKLLQHADFIPRLQEILILTNLESVLERLDEALSSVAMGVRYLKPLRATASRYYRAVDLSVSEIDPEGRNLPTYLASLHDTQRHSLNTWLKRHLGIEIRVKREGGQIMIMAKGPNDTSMSNLADMGFGLSQVLPIAVQLWTIGFNKSRAVNQSNALCVVVEQPELHLHPAYQAKLADVFVHSAEIMPGLSMIIETHSPHLINRIGRLIEEGRCPADNVSVVLFDVDHGTPGICKVQTSRFNQDGVLTDWPFGFFEAEA